MAQPNPPDANPLNWLAELLKPITKNFGKIAKQSPPLAYGGLTLVTILIVTIVLLIIRPNDPLRDLLIFAVVISLVFLGFAYLIVRMVSANSPHAAPEEEPDNKPRYANERNWEREYFLRLLDEGDKLPLELMDPRETRRKESTRLHDVFTTLDVADRRQPDEQERQFARELEREERRRLALEAISQPETSKAVLLGDAGAGKSTLAQYLTICLAGAHLSYPKINQLSLQKYGWQLGHLPLWPVYVLFREYAAHGLPANQTLWQFICDDLSKRKKIAGAAPLLEKQLESGNAVVILDGLDEVGQNDKDVRNALRRQVISFVGQFPKVRILITSRPYGYDNHWRLSDFESLELMPFNDEQIEEFITQWYQKRRGEDGNELRDRFLKQLKADRGTRLRQLAAQPLLLTMMSLIHERERGDLPEKRAKLYHECIVLLLDKWEKGKTVSDRPAKSMQDILGVGTDDLLALLAEVAYKAHEQKPLDKPLADIPGDLLIGVLLSKIKDKTHDETMGVLIRRGVVVPPLSEEEELRQELEGRTGLLSERGRNKEDTDNIYRFPHGSFQEYLAGSHLLEYDFPDHLAKLAAKDPTRWREVLLLATATAKPYMIWGLVGALCENKPPEKAADSEAWGPFLAGQALLEANMIAERIAAREDQQQIRNRIKKWHEAIVSQDLLTTRDRALAGITLAELGDNRPGVGLDPQTGLPDIAWGAELPAGTYTISREQSVTLESGLWLARYPVTNVQFQAFIDAPDWDKEDWWQGLPDDEQNFSQPYFPYANHPREWVSWYQAVAFCRWLTKKMQDGELKNMPLPESELQKYEIALPHEHEWEAAARYPHNRSYPWGKDEFDADKANTSEGGIRQTTAVGLYRAGRNTALKLYDLSGNVWEWCRNRVGENKQWRVVCGGSFDFLQDSAHAAYRGFNSPGDRDGSGFRVVLVLRSPSHLDP